jgi:hypothetical protein
LVALAREQAAADHRHQEIVRGAFEERTRLRDQHLVRELGRADEDCRLADQHGLADARRHTRQLLQEPQPVTREREQVAEHRHAHADALGARRARAGPHRSITQAQRLPCGGACALC